MITLEQFLWLIHYLLIAGYVFEIGRFIYLRTQYGELFKKVADIAPHIFARQWDLVIQGGVLTILLAHAVAFGFIVKAVPLFLIVLMGVFAFCGVRYEALKPYIKAHKRDNPKPGSKNFQYRVIEFILMGIGVLFGGFVAIAVKEANSTMPDFAFGFLAIIGLMLGKWIARKYFKTKPTNNPSNSNQKDEQAQNNFESEFDYDDEQFHRKTSDKGSSYAKPQSKKMPRGVDQRHPDDATFWAYVDDPTASEAERMKALKTILKRQAQRTEKVGQGLATTGV